MSLHEFSSFPPNFGLFWGGKLEKTGGILGGKGFLGRFVGSNRLLLPLLPGVEQHEVVGAVFQLAFGPLGAAAADCKLSKSMISYKQCQQWQAKRRCV